MIYLCNYAQNICIQSQKDNSRTFLEFGGDQAIEWNQEKINPSFVVKNQQIFNNKIGAGFWIWKPYIIYQTLHKLTEDDFLIYSDASINFIKPIFPLLKLCEEETVGIMPFHMEKEIKSGRNMEVFQTKRDVFLSLDCDNENTKTSFPKLASYSVWKKNAKTLAFLSEWLYYSQKIECIGNGKSILGEEDPRFRIARNDQSIYSTLLNKYQIKSFRDCSQWGNPFIDNDCPEYKQILDHHRIRK